MMGGGGGGGVGLFAFVSRQENIPVHWICVHLHMFTFKGQPVEKHAWALPLNGYIQDQTLTLSCVSLKKKTAHVRQNAILKIGGKFMYQSQG